MLDRPGDDFRLRRAPFLPEKRLHQQVDHVGERHVPHESSKERDRLGWVVRQLVQDQLSHLLRPDPVDFLTRQACGIDRRALEVLVPVRRVVHETAPAGTPATVVFPDTHTAG